MDSAKPGHTVTFQGLKGAAHLNGTEGRLIKYSKKEGRWSVRCSTTGHTYNDGALVNAKPENLIRKKALSGREAEDEAWALALTKEEPMKEILDDDLFRKPHEEECPICLSPLDFDVNSKVYMSCCGKLVCIGCDYGMSQVEDGEDPCPFCRTTTIGRKAPTISGMEGEFIKLRKQIDANDPVAIFMMANMYRGGKHGLRPDKRKAFEYMLRSAQLGNADANYDLSCTYYNKKDMTKATYYWSLAAMHGHAGARHNLGMNELNNKNLSRAMQHFRLAAEQGYTESMYNIKDMKSTGFISKQECDEILKAHKEVLASKKSDQRDRAKENSRLTC